MFSLSISAALLFATTVLYLLIRRFRSADRPSLAHIRGPAPESFLLGNLRQLLRATLPHTDLHLLNTYGSLARVRAPLGENRLWTADPSAIHHILSKSRDVWIKPHEARWALIAASGPGLTGVEGEDHRRQRRAVSRAFGVSEVRALGDGLRERAEKLVMHIIEGDQNGVLEGEEMDVSQMVGKGMLDAVGHAFSGYDFHALEGGQDDLVESLHGFMAKGFGRPNSFKIFMHGLMAHIPMPLLDVLHYTPDPGLAFLRRTVGLCNVLSRNLITEKTKRVENGDEKLGTDALSLIVKANVHETGRWRLGDQELVSQFASLIAAGHETTVTTLSWVLYELALHEDVQRELRAELEAASPDADLNNLLLLNAVIRETARFDTVVPHIFRVSTQDDIVPLSESIRTTTGEEISEVLVPKGTRVFVSSISYNRRKDIWGTDADTWRPSRWMDGTIAVKDSIGPYENLMSFGAGHRACVGWRYAIAELQIFLSTLIRAFEFRATARTKAVRRENCLVMLPMVEGEEDKGNRMPVEVRVIGKA